MYGGEFLGMILVSSLSGFCCIGYVSDEGYINPIWWHILFGVH